jgi:hypothetical protein
VASIAPKKCAAKARDQLGELKKRVFGVALASE